MSASLEAALHTVGLLGSAAISIPRLGYREGETIFAQGDEADAVFYIEHGVVRSYVSHAGKERVVNLLNPGEFLGISCIMGRKTRRMTAKALTACSILRIERQIMIDALRTNP